MENTLKSRDLERLYNRRFTETERKDKAKLWEVLIEAYLQRFFPESATIIDLGCGFCEFINAVKGGKKYGYDKESAFKAFAGPDVEFIAAREGRPIPLADETCDRVFASNFFEHLDSRVEIQYVLEEAIRLLKTGGKIVVIQPNIALAKEAYWDFIDHIVPLTDKSLGEAMEISGFHLMYVKRRFLPYTTKTVKAPNPRLLRIYLVLPFLWRIFGKQSLLIGEKLNG